MKFRMPDKKFIGGFIAGILWGGMIVFLGGILFLRHSLIQERECLIGFDSAVKELPARAAKLNGWTLQPVSCALPKASDMSRMQIFKLCHPGYALKMIDSAPDRRVSCMLPCSFAIYEKPDGKTYLARVNVSLLGRILGGEPSKTFPSFVTPDQEFMLSTLTK